MAELQQHMDYLSSIEQYADSDVQPPKVWDHRVSSMCACGYLACVHVSSRVCACVHVHLRLRAEEWRNQVAAFAGSAFCCDICKQCILCNFLHMLQALQDEALALWWQLVYGCIACLYHKIVCLYHKIVR